MSFITNVNLLVKEIDNIKGGFEDVNQLKDTVTQLATVVGTLQDAVAVLNSELLKVQSSTEATAALAAILDTGLDATNVIVTEDIPQELESHNNTLNELVAKIVLATPEEITTATGNGIVTASMLSEAQIPVAATDIFVAGLTEQNYQYSILKIAENAQKLEMSGIVNTREGKSITLPCKVYPSTLGLALTPKDPNRRIASVLYNDEKEVQVVLMEDTGAYVTGEISFILSAMVDTGLEPPKPKVQSVTTEDGKVLLTWSY